MVEESSIGFWFKGYDYFLDQFNATKNNVLKRRLLFKKYYILRGEEATALFYDQERLSRHKATPKRFKKTLFGLNGVQGLDGEQHKARKQLFMHCMNVDSLNQLNTYFDEAWFEAVEDWKAKNTINYFDEMERILFKCACKWIGLPFTKKDIVNQVPRISRMISSAGKIGIQHWRGRSARKATENWVKSLIKNYRNKKKNSDTIFDHFIGYKNPKGKHLPDQIVAVEILNLLRPIVAVARYMTFNLKALEDYPSYKEKLRENYEEYGENFIQEVRRFYPFFPVISGRIRKNFEFKGHKFTKGQRVLLDLYATNHYAKLWKAPERFYPERFMNAQISPFNLIPQGGGDHYKNHRCAGEWITINLMKRNLYFLIYDINYTVKSKNLRIKKNQFPPLPANGIKISKITKLRLME